MTDCDNPFCAEGEGCVGSCSDGDDDGDGFVDCNDDDCIGSPDCA